MEDIGRIELLLEIIVEELHIARLDREMPIERLTDRERSRRDQQISTIMELRTKALF